MNLETDDDIIIHLSHSRDLLIGVSHSKHHFFIKWFSYDLKTDRQASVGAAIDAHAGKPDQVQ